MAKKKVDFVKKIEKAESIKELMEIGEKVDIKDRDKKFVHALYLKMENLLAEKR